MKRRTKQTRLKKKKRHIIIHVVHTCTQSDMGEVLSNFFPTGEVSQ